MALIDVDYRTLRNIADEIDEYCSTQDKQMRAADAAVKGMLSAGFRGGDADAFRSSWNKVDDEDSTAVKFRESLKNYANCLRACADEYQKAQEDSYNQAQRLWR